MYHNERPAHGPGRHEVAHHNTEHGHPVEGDDTGAQRKHKEAAEEVDGAGVAVYRHETQCADDKVQRKHPHGYHGARTAAMRAV